MSIPRPIFVLNFCLITGLLAAASPARAERAENYNDAQLKLLFSGAKVEATGKATCQSWPSAGDVTVNFDFKAEGTLTATYNCTDNYVAEDDGTDTGTWTVEDGKLCVDFRTSVIPRYLPTNQNCWGVRHGTAGMAFYVGDAPFWQLSVSHPKYPTKEKLLAALGELAGKTAAKADLTLPPAEYKPLPAGTIINYDIRSYTVMESRGFEIVVKESKKGHWQRPYAVFGRQGFDSYTFRVRQGGRDWLYDANFDDAGKSALQRLWPLKVGNKTELGFEETYHGSSGGIPQRPWKLKLEVLRTEYLELNGIRYPTFVVRAHAVSEHQELAWADFPEQEYTETHWYNPDSGLVLKFRRDWIRGGEADSNDAYELVSVTFPKGSALALKPAEGPGAAQTAKATTLPPAPYKPLLVGTKIKYDDRIYRVTKTDGFLTVYRSITGDKLSYLNAYALFGEYAENLHVSHTRGEVIPYVIESDSRKILETFWPLEKGKKITYTLVEEATTASNPEEWNITLEVSGAEILNLKGTDYAAYVIEEKGRSESGKIYVGRKWYHPESGLIVKAERTWTKSFPVAAIWFNKVPNFAEGEVDNYTLVRARFPEGAVAVAAKQGPKAPPAVSAADEARLKQAAEKARAKAAQKIARLERKTKEARAEADRQVRAQELALLKREAEEKRKAEAARKARAVEIVRLEREAEENRQAEEARQARALEIARLKRAAEAARTAREAEVGKATAKEMARLKQEAEAVRRVHEAEIADLKREAEIIRKARKTRETEIARLKGEAEEAEKARLAEIARLKRETGEFQKALARRNALEAEEDKARKAEIANLKREAEEIRKAQEARDIQIASLRRQLEEVLKARKTAEAPKDTIADGLAGIDFGNYHALVIGINNYKNLPKLTTAINDAKGVANILKEEYGFKVSLLIDPDRLDIIDAFDEYLEILGPMDNLLIYYAGHGWLDEDLDRGYWLPVDAKPGRRGRWISNATITDTLKGLSAKHVMVVADSCYSGTLVRGADVGTRKRKGEYWKEMASKWARVAITSGGLEPVSDKGGGKNSPFAKAFIDALSDNDSIIDGLQLFGKMRRPVMIASDQTPQYADVRQAGHDGGDFLFVRRK